MYIFKFYVIFKILNSIKLFYFVNFIHHIMKFEIVKSGIDKLTCCWWSLGRCCEPAKDENIREN
jgi:hypothetical protein